MLIRMERGSNRPVVEGRRKDLKRTRLDTKVILGEQNTVSIGRKCVSMLASSASSFLELRAISRSLRDLYSSLVVAYVLEAQALLEA